MTLPPGFVALPLKGAVPGLTGSCVMRRAKRECRAIYRGGDGAGSTSGMRSW